MAGDRNMVCAEVAPSGEDAKQSIAGAGGMVLAETAPSQEEGNEPETPSAGWGSSLGDAGAVETRMREDEEEPSRWRGWSASWWNSAVAVGDYVVEPFYKQWVVESIQNGARPRARGAAAALAAGRGRPAWSQVTT